MKFRARFFRLCNELLGSEQTLLAILIWVVLPTSTLLPSTKLRTTRFSMVSFVLVAHFVPTIGSHTHMENYDKTSPIINHKGIQTQYYSTYPSTTSPLPFSLPSFPLPSAAARKIVINHPISLFHPPWPVFQERAPWKTSVAWSLSART